MAQKRMIDKKISVSEQVANLPIEAQLIFTWSIPHADDIGLLPISFRTLKAMILPMVDMPIEQFGRNIESIVSQGLYTVFEYEGEKFYRITKFSSHQTLKKDRQPQILINMALCKDCKKSWKKLEDLGFHLEDAGIQLETEVKRSEEKGIEEKSLTTSLDYLTNIPAEDLKEFTERFEVGVSGVKSKAEELANYCTMHGKRYKNYKAFLLNALKRDFRERPPKKEASPPPKVEVRTPEQEREIREGLEKIRSSMTLKK